jgi:hypothetical protein
MIFMEFSGSNACRNRAATVNVAFNFRVNRRSGSRHGYVAFLGDDVRFYFFVSFVVTPDYSRSRWTVEITERWGKQIVNLIDIGISRLAENQDINVSTAMFIAINVAKPALFDDWFDFVRELFGTIFVFGCWPSVVGRCPS